MVCLLIHNRHSALWTWKRWKLGKTQRWYWGGYYSVDLAEGIGFLVGVKRGFEKPTEPHYDPARCGAFADWLDDNKKRLLEPHTDLRAEAEERLDSLIKWLRSGLQVEG